MSMITSIVIKIFQLKSFLQSLHFIVIITSIILKITITVIVIVPLIALITETLFEIFVISNL